MSLRIWIIKKGTSKCERMIGVLMIPATPAGRRLSHHYSVGLFAKSHSSVVRIPSYLRPNHPNRLFPSDEDWPTSRFDSARLT
ncbi:MAG TPA: hypothetical protein VGS11_02180 [Candidatus Bathyarchaeia archaeon]|nr:hypothetical protein [Candidatus Bathyarchaeia archaeon]